MLRLKPPPNNLIYLITNRKSYQSDDRGSESDKQIEAVRIAAEAGCQLIQIREKDLDTRALSRFSRSAIEAAHRYDKKVLINDRLDVAFAVGADGVHLRVDSIPCSVARRAADARGLTDFMIGVSTHSLDQALDAWDSGADFIVCGPVFETPTKMAYGAPLGLERFGEICRRVRIPVIALGGVTLANYREALEAGAAGIAAIGLFANPDKLKLDEVIKELLT